MEIGLVRKIDIEHEMQQAYLDYAMSVIVARALPDARDGLKPVHRRILYAMYDMGLRTDSSHKKSARIVGEVLGKYHPHGDVAVYEAMARMAQDFSMRYQLVDGQGNFGSVDGDPPAAMRYTEARMASPAGDMLSDIQKNTVDFTDNFDGTLKEPSVLPAAIPNLLVNGATGIAVGMSTSIPPHNLSEVVDALIYMLERWDRLDDINVDDLMRFIQGPDFPTGGIILVPSDDDVVKSAYGSGRGRITLQARAHIEEMSRGRARIIVTELPYMTNKSSLIERIADQVREEKLTGITDLRDESDREGMRIVIELSKASEASQILADLYAKTPMQSTFSIITLALVDGEPRLLPLKQALRVYLDHRQVVIRRRSEYDLEKAKQRAHILEGLRIALKNLDEVIDTIRRSQTAETAQNNLMRRFKLTEVQAQAILNMPLRRLAALERKKIEDEYQELLKTIRGLETLLKSPKKIRAVIAEELGKVKEAYGDRRRTQIVRLGEGQTRRDALTARDLAPDKTVWVSVTEAGVVSRTIGDKQPRISGRAAPAWLLQAHTQDTLYLVTEDGDAAAIAVHTLPETDDPDQGTEFHRVSSLKSDDLLAVVFNLPAKDVRAEGWFALTVTRGGMVKKTEIGELPGPSAQAFTLVKVNEGDRLGWVLLTDGKAEILLATASGMAIRFSEDDVRPMGLVAAGVMGIKLKVGDQVTGTEMITEKGEIFLMASNGQAKRVKPDQFPTQGRYGQGVIAWSLPTRTRLVGVATGKPNDRVTANLLKLAPKALRLDAAPVRTRAARGTTVVDLKPGDEVLNLTIPIDYPRPVKETPPEEKPKPARRTHSTTSSKSRTKRSKSGTASKGKTTPKPGTRKTRTRSSTASGKTSTRKTSPRKK
ncbi:MAG TPA: DNA gyrase subunit A [Anaerolineales bacterium]|nr:DNA gyrase subunit A [Anaerolineales bacterium]